MLFTLLLLVACIWKSETQIHNRGNWKRSVYLTYNFIVRRALSPFWHNEGMSANNRHGSQSNKSERASWWMLFNGKAYPIVTYFLQKAACPKCPKQHYQLRTKCLNAWDYGRHLLFKPPHQCSEIPHVMMIVTDTYITLDVQWHSNVQVTTLIPEFFLLFFLKPF